MKLILHADDLGLHPAVNKAIFECAEAGVLTSASMMVNGSGTAEVFEWAKGQNGFGIGLHLNILRGRPLSDPADIPSLVGADGLFLNSAPRFLKRGITGRISSDEILAEYRLQLGCMLEKGITPSHFDGEKHSHLFLSQTVQAMDRLMAESGINRLRLINESQVVSRIRKNGITVKGSMAQRMKLAFLESRTRKSRPVLQGCKSTDYSFGILLSGRIVAGDTRRLLDIMLSLAENSTVEWMFHPGYPFDSTGPDFTREFGQFFLHDARDRERTVLLSPEIKGLLQEHREQLITYREL